MMVISNETWNCALKFGTVNSYKHGDGAKLRGYIRQI